MAGGPDLGVSWPSLLLDGALRADQVSSDSAEEVLVAGPDMVDIRESLNGDGDAYARLIARHQSKVASRMWRFTRDTFAHRDLVHEVFVEAYLSLKTYRAKAPFEHWLARIGTSVGYRYWKKKERERLRVHVPIEDCAELPSEDREPMEPSRAADLLHGLMDRLAARDRLVLTLRYVENRSVEETADLSGWTRTMVKVQTWRARKKLKKLLQDAGVEVG